MRPPFFCSEDSLWPPLKKNAQTWKKGIDGVMVMGYKSIQDAVEAADGEAGSDKLRAKQF